MQIFFALLFSAAVADDECVEVDTMSALQSSSQNVKRHLQQSCTSVVAGQKAPINGLFSATDGSKVDYRATRGDVAQSAGRFCVDEPTVSLLQRAFSVTDVSEFDVLVQKKSANSNATTESSVAGKKPATEAQDAKCDPRKETATGCPNDMQCCDDGSGSHKIESTEGTCFNPSAQDCLGPNYGSQVKYGVVPKGMNKCLEEVFQGPDELCCKGGYMFQNSFLMTDLTMTCCNNLEGHAECAPGVKCVTEGSKSHCEEASLFPDWSCACGETTCTWEEATTQWGKPDCPTCGSCGIGGCGTCPPPPAGATTE